MTQLTYKSTYADLNHLVRHGRLIEFIPDLGFGEVHRRRLWLHPDIQKWLLGLRRDDAHRAYSYELESYLKSFVIGSRFDVDKRLKRLMPEDRAL
jgi:hypothetical protein